MQILSRPRLRTMLVLLMGLSILAVAGSIAVAASLMRNRMMDDRMDKLTSVVDTTIGVAKSLESEVAAHRFSPTFATRRQESSKALIFHGESCEGRHHSARGHTDYGMSAAITLGGG